MAAADYRLLTEATGQRIAAALEALSGTGAAAAAARTNLDVYSKGETDNAIAQSTATAANTAAANYSNLDKDAVIDRTAFNYAYMLIQAELRDVQKRLATAEAQLRALT